MGFDGVDGLVKAFGEDRGERKREFMISETREEYMDLDTVVWESALITGRVVGWVGW